MFMFFFGRQKDRGKFDIFFLRFSQHDTKGSLLENSFQELEFRFMRVFLKKNIFVSKKRYSIINDKRDKKRNSFEKSANFKLFTMVENAIGVLDK